MFVAVPKQIYGDAHWRLGYVNTLLLIHDVAFETAGRLAEAPYEALLTQQRRSL